MSGRVVQQVDVTIAKKGKQHVKIALDRPQYDKLLADGSALISFETANDEVQAFFVPDLPTK
jgi:hypothetical protein